jgi:hypothetical protein
VTICPCCGFRFEGDLENGCQGCGARAVGEPLPKPDQELPAYGRPLLLVASAVAMILGFLAQTIAARIQDSPLSFSFWSWIAAGETAAWRLKWIAVPVSLLVLWGGKRVYRSMAEAPARFVGVNLARRGLIASACVSLLIATLIGVTVPERLRQRRDGIEAGTTAMGYTIARAMLEYRERYGTYPAVDDIPELTDLPDEDGSIAAALAAGYAGYKPSGSEVAELPAKEKSRTLRGAVIRTVAANSTSDEAPGVGVSFTNYDIQLPGEDKVLGTEDDLVLRDGVVMKATEATTRATPVSGHARARKP